MQFTIWSDLTFYSLFISDMWYQASRQLCRHSNLAETTLKFLSCTEISLYSPLLTSSRQVQNAAQQLKTKEQKVVKIKYTNKVRRRIEIYPPPSLIPSQSVILPVCILILLSFYLFNFALAHYSTTISICN